MSTTPEPSEMLARHSAVLARLTELGLALAERVQAEAMAATAPEDLDRMSQSFHRVSRSVRMSMALEAKLARDERVEAQALAKAAAQAAPKPAAESEPRLTRREGLPEARLYMGAWPDWDDTSESPVLRTGNEREAEKWAAEAATAGPVRIKLRLSVMKAVLKEVFGEAYAQTHAEALVASEIAQAKARATARAAAQGAARGPPLASTGAPTHAASPDTS